MLLTRSSLTAHQLTNGSFISVGADRDHETGAPTIRALTFPASALPPRPPPRPRASRRGGGGGGRPAGRGAR